MENTDIRQSDNPAQSSKAPRWAVALVTVGSVLVLAAVAGLIALSFVRQGDMLGQPASQDMSVDPRYL